MPLFSRIARKPQVTPLAPDEPNELEPPEVPFDPGLIATLLQEHRDMVLLLDKAQGSVQAQRFEGVNDMLNQLRDALAAHVQRESEQLHPYLATRLKNYGRATTVKSMRTDALHTQRALDGFLSHYGGYPVTERNASIFHAEIAQVSREFQKWLQQEETAIYPLYKPPGTAD